MMETFVFNKKTRNLLRQQTDRFVLPRETLQEKRRRKSWPLQSKHVDVWDSKYMQQKKRVMVLEEAFGFEQRNFQTTESEIYSAWPCKPRDRKYLSLADSILDLPNYSDADFPELLDWSSDNVLVAALGQMYHKWSWRTQNLIEHSMTKYPIACCKFHPRGKLLALGTTFRSTEIHDNVLSKCITCSYCECQIFRMGQSTCAITAVEWSPTGTSYAMGCSAGMIRSFTNNSDAMFRRKITTSAILFIRISPDSRYVAVTSVDKDVIHILNWPSFDIYSVLETAAWTVKAINWHPWRSALLGVGIITDDIYAHVVLWEVPSGKVTEYGLSHNHYYLDALLFSHRTGELVVSLHDLKVPNPSSQLVVMSDQDTAVDQWGGGRAFPERVRHMIFSPDGSKLASATSGEDLIIWNFLPEDKNKMKTSKFASIPLYMDIVSLGYSVR